ncbi:MAG: polymer-forming cytoskeletal protein [Verrucomicrobiota bacterium]
MNPHTPPSKKSIQCPYCGHEQMEYPEISGTTCQACSKYIYLSRPQRRKTSSKIKQIFTQRKEIRCFHCGHIEMVPESSLSWQCTACSGHVDLETHEIQKGCTMNIFTHGGVIIGPRGHFLGSRAEAEWIRLGGSSSGVLVGKKITVDGQAHLKANATGESLDVEPGASVDAKQLMEFQSAFIQGKVFAKQLKVLGDLKISSLGEAHVDQAWFNTLTVEPGGKFFALQASTLNPEVSLEENPSDSVE